jgi:glucose-6-phosphate-specific signal transduction histidine kinase
VVKAGFVVLAWFGAYGLTWASEWALAIWMSEDGHQTGLSIVRQIALRLYGVEPDSVVPMYPLVPTLMMIVQSFISVGSIAVAIFAAATAAHLRTNWPAFEWRRFLLLISPTLVATAWFEILNNHTQTHSHFTYRSESAAIAIIFAAALMATDAPATIGSLLRNLRQQLRRGEVQAAG